MLRARSLTACLLFAALAQSAAAQAIHRVGAGHFATIQAAIDAAAPGDVVLVEAGVYPSFRVGKPLTITAEPSALVQVVGDDPLTIVLQPMERVHLAGLDVHVSAITIRGGMVSADRCTMTTNRGLRVADSTVLLRWSSAGALQGSGILLQNANLHASDGTFSTAAGSSAGSHPAALEIEGASHCSLSLCSLFGAWPATATSPLPSPALRVTGVTATVARVWVADCTLVGGSNPAGQGPAVVAPPLPAPAPVRFHQCQILGATVGAVAYGPVLGLRSSVDMAIGTTFTSTMRGEPAHWFLFYAGSDVLGPWQIPEVEQPAFGFLDVVTFPITLSNAQGEVHFPVAVPNDPALRHTALWWRGIDIAVFPWQATPAFVTITQ